MQAAAAPQTARHSASLLQGMQMNPWVQNPALPVVVSHTPEKPVLVVQRIVVLPPQPVSRWPAGHVLSSWATHRLLSRSPRFGFLPWQMPEQQCLALPRHLPPTSTQPKALSRSFDVRFLAWTALGGGGAGAKPRRVAARPRSTTRREDPVVSAQVKRSKCEASKKPSWHYCRRATHRATEPECR